MHFCCQRSSNGELEQCEEVNFFIWPHQLHWGPASSCQIPWIYFNPQGYCRNEGMKCAYLLHVGEPWKYAEWKKPNTKGHSACPLVLLALMSLLLIILTASQAEQDHFRSEEHNQTFFPSREFSTNYKRHLYVPKTASCPPSLSHAMIYFPWPTCQLQYKLLSHSASLSTHSTCPIGYPCTVLPTEYRRTQPSAGNIFSYLFFL